MHLRGQHRLIGLLLLAIAPLSIATAPVQVMAPQVSYRFGEYLKFTGRVDVLDNVQSAFLYMTIPGEFETFGAKLELDPAGNLIYEFPLDKHPLRAFSRPDYWIEITTQTGLKITSEKTIFNYIDNRYSWLSRQSSPFTAYWYQGDQAFGQMMIDISQAGLQKI